MPCPACRGVGGRCQVCSGGRVALDVAVSWAIEHGSQPSQPAPPRDQEPSDADRVLLNAIESVLEKVAGVEGQEGAQALVERSTALRDTILAWQRSEPGAGERDGIASKVLGLHVALSRLTRGEPR